MSTWSELVTTALLGLDRRPLPVGLRAEVASMAPGAEPVEVLLREAARHRAAASAAAPLQRCPAPPSAPDDDVPPAPDAAQELLGRLLARPVAELVNAWLAAALAHRRRAAPEHWTDLAALSATRTDYDRRLLAWALGPSGSWFLDQNPAWERLAEAVRRHVGTGLAVEGSPAAQAAAPMPDETELHARPDSAFQVDGPWPRALSVAALQVILSGQLGWRASRYAASVGARLAPADHDLLQQAMDALPEDGWRSAPGLRLVREAMGAAAQSASARAEIDRAFVATSSGTKDQEEIDEPE